MQFFLILYLQLQKNDYLCAWVSHTRPAPSEFPQGLIAARVGGCSGAMYQAYPFLYPYPNSIGLEKTFDILAGIMDIAKHFILIWIMYYISSNH